MSYKRRSNYKRPRERTEVRVAVLTSLAIVLATGSLVWFLRPNRESPSSPPVVTTAPAVPTDPASSAPPESTAPATTPASSTP